MTTKASNMAEATESGGGGCGCGNCDGTEVQWTARRTAANDQHAAEQHAGDSDQTREHSLSDLRSLALALRRI